MSPEEDFIFILKIVADYAQLLMDLFALPLKLVDGTIIRGNQGKVCNIIGISFIPFLHFTCFFFIFFISVLPANIYKEFFQKKIWQRYIGKMLKYVIMS